MGTLRKNYIFLTFVEKSRRKAKGLTMVFKLEFFGLSLLIARKQKPLANVGGFCFYLIFCIAMPKDKEMLWEEYKHKAKASELLDERLKDFIQLLYCKQHKYFKAWVGALDYWLRKNYEENDYNVLMKKAKVLFKA